MLCISKVTESDVCIAILAHEQNILCFQVPAMHTRVPMCKYSCLEPRPGFPLPSHQHQNSPVDDAVGMHKPNSDQEDACHIPRFPLRVYFLGRDPIKQLASLGKLLQRKRRCSALTFTSVQLLWTGCVDTCTI